MGDLSHARRLAEGGGHRAPQHVTGGAEGQVPALPAHTAEEPARHAAVGADRGGWNQVELPSLRMVGREGRC